MTTEVVVFRDVEVEGQRVDVRCEDGVVAEMVAAGELGLARGVVLHGDGGALLPGLHDHHVHLLAMAAARMSVPLGPPTVIDRAGLAAALIDADRRLPAGAWIRATGYHESVAGELSCEDLDALVPDRPVRVQHRSGLLWILNRAGCREVGVDAGNDGRLFGADTWLRERLAPVRVDLAAVGRSLSEVGVTGVTDMTPFDRSDAFESVAEAVSAGELPQRVTMTGGPALASTPVRAPVRRGPVKLYLADHELPDPDDVASWIRIAHEAGRAVAVHSVTAASLAVALAAWMTAGAMAGDRVEHGSVIPIAAVPRLAALGITVVTQPNLVAERGDAYVTDVDADDIPDLWRLASLRAGGVAVAAGTDAPFGAPDPWAAIAAAANRTTASGVVLGADERISARDALGLFLGPLERPGGIQRRLGVGAPADVCLLDRPLVDALAEPARDVVAATVIAGRVVWERPD